MMTGGVRPVSSVSGPSASTWLKRRRDGLAAQHRALDEGRIDDLVKLMRDEREPGGDEPETDGDDSPDDEAAEEAPVSEAALAREVTALATELEARIARFRTETLDELQELDRRVDAGRFGRADPRSAGKRRGGQFSAYL